MKWDCDKGPARRRAKREARLKYLGNWHSWFAWYPVKVGPNDCRWLEVIERAKGVIASDAFIENTYYVYPWLYKAEGPMRRLPHFDHKYKYRAKTK